MAGILCKKCNEMSTDAEFCSECGAPMAGVVSMIPNAAPSASEPATASYNGSSSRRGSVIATQVGGYARSTGRVVGARRPQPPQGSPSSGTIGSALALGTSTSKRGSRGSSTRRKSLGGGLFSLPPMPSLEPEKRILKDPRVPDSKLVCIGTIRESDNPAEIGKPCGARLNPDKKFCPRCGTSYRLKPALKAGDVVAGQYEIRGAMAFGGLGWIYLGMDNKLNRWVVLKGLLNAADEAAAAAAVAERQFLAKVKHGKIVGIYNFVTYNSESYIVMEYVGGRTLKEIRKDRGPLPAREAIAYILGILPAFGYLHAENMVYCDFKPDNFMLEGEDVKLIDMGGVRQIGDPNGDVYGTKGYMAPEAGDDPTACSDLYTIGRTLAALMMDFDNLKAHEFDLPAPTEVMFIVPRFPIDELGFDGAVQCEARLADGSPLPQWLSFGPDKRGERWYFSGNAPSGVFEIPVTITVTGKDSNGSVLTKPLNFNIAMPLAEYESLYRFLVKATAQNPDARFQNADEMSAQLLGVLREIVARDGAIPSMESAEFMPEREISGTSPVLHKDAWLRLPEPRLDPEDSAASALFSAAATTDQALRRKILIETCSSNQQSEEARLRLADFLITTGQGERDVMKALDSAAALDAFDWRPDWYCGRLYLSLSRFAEATECFDRVYSEIPGESVPKLALAIALEGEGRFAEAAGLYDTVSRTDPSLTAASIGLARCRSALSDRNGAVEAFRRVSAAASSYGDAMLAAVRVLVDSSKQPPSRDDFMVASSILSDMKRNDVPYHETEAALAIEAALQVESGNVKPDKADKVLGVAMQGKSLRHRAEAALRACARMADSKAEMIAYVDAANRTRPWTVF